MGGDPTSPFPPLIHSLQDPQSNHVDNNLEEVHDIHLAPAITNNGLVGKPQITWRLPEAQVLPFNPAQTEADIEAFPDFPNPANNLILARTALLEQLDSTNDSEAYPKLRPRHPFDAIHSRVVSHTGHIKEHENLNRSKVSLTSALTAIEKGRQDRALGNRRRLFTQRHLYANAICNSRSTQPRDELRKTLKTRAEKGVRDAFSYEREYGWDIVTEQPSISEFRDFHDPYWQLRMASELQAGAELTRSVITSLLMLKQTLPLHYLTININPAAVAVGLNGHPRPSSPTSGFMTKKFKPSRLLGLSCNSTRASRWSSLVSETGPLSPTAATRSTGSAFKVKTVTLMRRVATKLTARRLSKKNLAISRKQSASPDVVEVGLESDYEDSDDEYADAAEFLKQEEQSKEKVSQWLTLNFDDTPFDDQSLVELGPIEPSDIPSPRTVMFSAAEAVLATLPSSSSNVTSSISHHHKNADRAAAGAVASRHELPVFSPISTFSPFEISESDPPSDDGSDQDQNLESSSIDDDFTVIETVTLRKPIVPARMVSVHQRTKNLKHQFSVRSVSTARKSGSNHARATSVLIHTSDDGIYDLQATTASSDTAASIIGQCEETLTKEAPEAILSSALPVSNPRQVLHCALKAGDLRGMADAETAAEFKAPPSAVSSTRGFHGCLIGGSLPSADGAVNTYPSQGANLSANLRFSQRQREFLHRRYHKGQGHDQGQGQGQVQVQLKSDKPSRKSRCGGLFQKLTCG